MQFVRSIRPIRYGKPHVLTGETIQRNLRDRLKSTERDEAKDLKCQGMATACGKVVWAPYEVLTRGDVYCPDGPSICMTCKKHEGLPHHWEIFESVLFPRPLPKWASRLKQAYKIKRNR